MWVLFSIGVVFVVVVIGAVVMTRDRSAPQTRSELSGDDLFSLGVVFAGAGVAMSLTLGPFMIWMFALGIIYMAMGTRRRRRQ